jgi:hypothetical protein
VSRGTFPTQYGGHRSGDGTSEPRIPEKCRQSRRRAPHRSRGLLLPLRKSDALRALAVDPMRAAARSPSHNDRFRQTAHSRTNFSRSHRSIQLDVTLLRRGLVVTTRQSPLTSHAKLNRKLSATLGYTNCDSPITHHAPSNRHSARLEMAKNPIKWRVSLVLIVT